MENNYFIVQGGTPLFGEVSVSGAKNAALGIVAAAVMSDEDVIVRNIPAVSDLKKMLELLKGIGAKVKQLDEHDYVINGASIRDCVVKDKKITKMRAGYYLLGALLGKYHHAEVALPGGCAIGKRPIDLHLKGFETLGATTQELETSVIVEAEELQGGHIFFDTVSVGATINVMMAAVLAKGRTVLENAAKEPHVVDVANFLNSMGARIKGAGTDTIRIDGVTRLYKTDYTVIPDQIEAGTYMVMAAATGGNVLVTNVIPKHLECITSKLREIGCTVNEYDDSVRISVSKKLRGVRIKTLPYPGFPTDMQSQFLALLVKANGQSTITETIFENRFTYAKQLNKMGAVVKSVTDSQVITEGVEELHGAELCITDLRAGAALVIAALSAEGTSILSETCYIDRGYEKMDEKIRNLGGKILSSATGEIGPKELKKLSEM